MRVSPTPVSSRKWPSTPSTRTSTRGRSACAAQGRSAAAPSGSRYQPPSASRRGLSAKAVRSSFPQSSARLAAAVVAAQTFGQRIDKPGIAALLGYGSPQHWLGICSTVARQQDLRHQRGQHGISVLRFPQVSAQRLGTPQMAGCEVLVGAEHTTMASGWKNTRDAIASRPLLPKTETP